MTLSQPIQIRKMKDGDKGFVLTHWLVSYRLTVRWLVRAEYDRLYRTAICRMINSPQCEVLVASNPGMDDNLFSFVCAEPKRDLLHYCYTRDSLRRCGIVRSLMGEMFKNDYWVPTHWTADLSLMWDGGGLRPDLFTLKEA